VWVHLEGPIKTEVIKTAAGWELRRGGQPFFVKGVGRGRGGFGSLKHLVEIGGNTVREWAVAPETPGQLDEAARLGVAMCVGLWLGRPKHGFNYADPQVVARQLAAARADVLRFKDHPAVLMWGLGNEPGRLNLSSTVLGGRPIGILPTSVFSVCGNLPRTGPVLRDTRNDE